MATVPLGAEDCDRLANIMQKNAEDTGRIPLHDSQHLAKVREARDFYRRMATAFRAAAANDRRPVVQEDAPVRRGSTPLEVDTFPVCAEGDGIERCVVGADKHPGCWDERLDVAGHQEAPAAPAAGHLEEAKGLCPECETWKDGGNCPPEHFGVKEAGK